MFFNNLDSYVPNYEERYRRNELQFAELTEFFLHRFNDTTPEYWFDTQVKAVFGLDVYAVPFDRGRGYQIYENERARLVVIRLEDFNRAVPPALKDFLGIPDFRVVRANIGESNAYGQVYKDYLKTAPIPRDYIEANHATRYAQHFYTPEELEASVAGLKAG
jgi:hypothetical protein